MRIEDIVKSRKEQLDVEQAPESTWNQIRMEWHPNSKKKLEWWKVAAIIFITTSVALLIHNISLQNQVNKLATLGDISEEYYKIEKGYITQINHLETNLSLNQLKQKKEYQWLFDELDNLDKINKIYRADIGVINDAHLVEALIDYYEKKIKLLNKIELEIERTNKLKNDETTNSDSISI